jgi:hypothetical protein
MIDLLSSRSQWKLRKGERMIYYRLALDAVTGLLTNGKTATCLRRDPTGKASLTSAKHIRKKLKGLKRSGKEWAPAMERAVAMVLSE